MGLRRNHSRIHGARASHGGLKARLLAGERADPETIKWAETNLSVPVYEVVR